MGDSFSESGAKVNCVMFRACVPYASRACVRARGGAFARGRAGAWACENLRKMCGAPALLRRALIIWPRVGS